MRTRHRLSAKCTRYLESVSKFLPVMRILQEKIFIYELLCNRLEFSAHAAECLFYAVVCMEALEEDRITLRYFRSIKR